MNKGSFTESPLYRILTNKVHFLTEITPKIKMRISDTKYTHVVLSMTI